MHSVPIDIFFSCSFEATDKSVNEFFLAICNALSLRCANVSTGSSRTPPAEAKAQIERAQAVVAVCPRRKEMKAGGYVMPPAVRDEIAIAFATGTPLLMIVENEVDFSGFQPNFGTYLKFDRGNFFDPVFLEKAVEAIHNIKLTALGPQDASIAGLPDSYAEFINHSVELRSGINGLTWHYSTVKRLTYSQPSRRSFPVGVWATVPVRQSDAHQKMEWSISLRASSRNMTIEQVIDKHTANCVEARIKLNPPAEEGDFIEYVTHAASPYINPIWLEDVDANSSTTHLNDGSFICSDGLMFIHRTKKAVIEFRISQESGLIKSDIRPFVGSYSTTMDYEVESEIKRAVVRMEDFGGSILIRLEIESPLPGHMYGIAWNPKNKPRQMETKKVSHVITTDESDLTDDLIER